MVYTIAAFTVPYFVLSSLLANISYIIIVVVSSRWDHIRGMEMTRNLSPVCDVVRLCTIVDSPQMSYCSSTTHSLDMITVAKALDTSSDLVSFTNART